MKVLFKEPGKQIRPIVIDRSLKTLQDLVDGNIEHYKLNERTGLLFNEEGKLRGLKANFYLPALNDMIVGNAIFIGEDGEEFTDISKEDADIVATFMTYLVGLWPTEEEA